MGKLIVIEGLDGSGKRTLAGRFAAALRSAGATVAEQAFPRYGRSVYADLVHDLLYRRMGDLTDSVYGSALLFALDRHDAAETLRGLLAGHDVVLLDRYVTSNAAYGAARLGAPETPTDFPEWIRALELGRFAEPAPDHQILLATSVAVAAQRAQQRAETDATRALDEFEADAALQRRTAAMYRELAAAEYLSPWTVLEPGPPRPFPSANLVAESQLDSRRTAGAPAAAALHTLAARLLG